MGRLLSIDYGRKRTGLAVTDPLQIIATPLTTVPTHQLISYLTTYCQQEEVEKFILGYPIRLDGSDTDTTSEVRTLAKQLEKKFVGKIVDLHDERFTTQLALEAMIAGGTSKKYRRQKENIDKISATIILQSYLAANS